MIIKPQKLVDPLVVTFKENNIKPLTNKTEIYISKIDRRPNIFGKMQYDVMVVSEIITADEIEFKTLELFEFYAYKEFGKEIPFDTLRRKAFVKIIHFFTGEIDMNELNNVSDKSELFSKMTLYHQVSATANYIDHPMNFIRSMTLYKGDNKTAITCSWSSLSENTFISNMLYNNNRDKMKSKKDYYEYLRIASNCIPYFDISDPRYPSVKTISNVSHSMLGIAVAGKNSYKGSEFANISKIRVYEIEKDWNDEERYNEERRMKYRALLSLDNDAISDNLVQEIEMRQMARNISTDLCKLDIGSCLESYSAIFDSATREVGIKQFVSPFGELYSNFVESQSSFMISEIRNICVKAICEFNDHYRITINSDKLEFTVKITNFSINNMSTTIKMNKCEMYHDYIIQYISKQNTIKEYYK